MKKIEKRPLQFCSYRNHAAEMVKRMRAQIQQNPSVSVEKLSGSAEQRTSSELVNKRANKE
ncbi:MAG: hypothetical protein OEZ58_15675 [Gammaproteobacteria bacterium]|nr:hypothetical protein [Gammaproteobacteria bacterium]MDH5730433.1 hypothetical protein [Gammaproteobacteria bacterium]